MTRDVLLTCPLDCPDACRLKVTFGPDPQASKNQTSTEQIGTERMLKLTGDPNHPYTRGFACAKTVHYPARANHPDRPLYPMRRVGQKTDAQPQFERISWDEALDEIAGKLKILLEQNGPESILRYHYAGTMGLMENNHAHALWRALGTPELEETICASAGTEAWSMGYGARYAVDPLDVPNAKLIVLWGINSLSTHSHLTPQITAARKNGARVVCIDPYRNRTANFADQHYKIKPATDAALALGIMQQLFKNNWLDHEYIAAATQDIEELRAEASEWTPQRTAEVTGLSTEDVTELARAIGTTRPTYIRVGYGMTRHEFGGSNLRAVTLIPALTGDWRHLGGGCVLSSSGAFHLNRTQLGAAHLLKPQTKRVNMNHFASALAPQNGVQATVIYNCNPAVVAPNSGQVRVGLQRPDLLVVVLEQALTETARLADYILPATTFAEHPDMYTSYGHHWLSYNPAAINPPAETRPNSWVFQQLAQRLGVTEPSVYWSVDELMAELLNTNHPYLAGITPQRLKEQGSIRLNLPSPFLPYADGAPTPSSKVKFAPVPKYQEATAQLNEEYPLRLITPPAHHFLNSTYGMLANLNKAEGTEPHMLVHPSDALKAGLQNGEYAVFASEIGQTKRRIKLSEEAQCGVVVLEGTWWGLQAADSESINVLTAETLTDLGGGSTFHNTRVSMTKQGVTKQGV